jgi:transposase InsO family protein
MEQNFIKDLENQGIIQFFNYPKRPQMNAQIESFNRIIQEDFINWHLDLLATNINAFNQKLVDWLLCYNTKRVHPFINNQSPSQYLINNLGFSKMLGCYVGLTTKLRLII